MRRLQRLQHASYPPRSLPPRRCAEDQTMRRPWTHRHHAHLPAYSGVPSPGKETSPHGAKLRGGGTRGAGGVLVMGIARPGQARSWRHTWRGRRSGDEHRSTGTSPVVADMSPPMIARICDSSRASLKIAMSSSVPSKNSSKFSAVRPMAKFSGCALLAPGESETSGSPSR